MLPKRTMNSFVGFLLCTIVINLVWISCLSPKSITNRNQPMVLESRTCHKATKGALNKAVSPYASLCVTGDCPFFARGGDSSLSSLCTRLKDKNEPQGIGACGEDNRLQLSSM